MEMNELPTLVTSYTFKEKQYIVKMTLVRKNSLELSVIDKYSAEEWRCSYDSTYIENLTHKTGNYKQFDIFVAMLKSGLLQTSECVTIDLLTLEDLEFLRRRRVTANVNGTRFASESTQTLNSESKLANRRYLILTYTVEFDRIHYPLPLEYVGLPNPQMLQGTIRRLEAEIEKLKSKFIYEGERIEIEMWSDRIRELEAENYILTEEVAYLRQLLVKKTGSGSGPSPGNIPAAFQSLEEQVRRERASFKATLNGLQEQNLRLKQELEDLHAKDLSSIKHCPASVVWKDNGQSPVARIRKFSSPRLEGISGLPSSEILSKNSTHKNEKWRDMLNRNDCKKKLSKTSCEHKCNDKGRSHSQGRERSSSGSSYHSRSSCHSRSCYPSRSSNTCDVNTKPQSTRRNMNRESVCKRNYLSSRCSDTSQRGEKKDISSRIRSSSRSSTCSDASLSSGSRSSIKSGKQDIPSKSSRKSSTVLLRGCNQNSNANVPRAKSKFSLRKDSFLKKDARAGISELEARIKALQKLLREGISFP